MDACTEVRWSACRVAVAASLVVCLATVGLALGQDTNVKRVGILGKPVAIQDPGPPKTGDPAKQKTDAKDGVQDPVVPPQKGFPSLPPTWAPPKVEPGEVALPINLATALRLANVRALDITIAQQQLGIAIAQYRQAQVLWLPNIDAGLRLHPSRWPHSEYRRQHNQQQPQQPFCGQSAVAVFGLTDAIFASLAAQQVARAKKPTSRLPPTIR